MSRILVSYATGEGQTAAVADRIGTTLEDRGHAVTVHDIVRDGEVALARFDAVLVGASIHVGRHQSSVTSFLETHRDALAERPTGFFQISLSSATAEGRAQAATYVDTLLEETGWNPDRIGLFGGALRYSKYGFVKRLMMKRIAKRQLPEIDHSHDVELTDWAEVEAFADDFAAFVEHRTDTAQIV